jgi:hypothetical protein
LKVALLGAALALSLAACSEKKAEPLKTLAPEPLPRLELPASADGGEDREAIYRVEPSPVFGEEAPAGAQVWKLEASGVRVGESVLDAEKADDAARLKALLPEGAKVLLTSVGDVYLAQVAGALALLDDAGAEVFLAHPDGKVAYPLELRDEPGFQNWLDEAKPGKVRIIQRADGFELQTNVGKLPGADPNGPTVPLRGGQLDLATLRRGLGRLKDRFKVSPDVCYLPSFGTEISKVSAAMSSNYRAAGEPIFEETCLVYPRPAPAKP